MKKLACLLMALVMVLAMATAASAEWKFERKIDIVCPWGVGGGADSTIPSDGAAAAEHPRRSGRGCER